MNKLLPILAFVAGCSKDNPYYCAGNPDDSCAIDAGDGTDGPSACTSSAECAGTLPVCDPVQEVCVACTATEIGACSGATPVCSGNRCTRCELHGQCASNACLPSGECGDDTTVAYVKQTGNDGNPCSKDMPCQQLSVAATKGKPYVKIDGNLDEAVVLNGVTVTVLAAPGTVIKRTASIGPIFDLAGQTTVVLEDLIIRDAAGTTGHGVHVGAGEPVTLTLNRVHVVSNGGNGLYIAGGRVTMSRTVVSVNTYGGAIISAGFDITNSLFVENGGPGATTGGLMLTPQGAGNVFAFNTVAQNQTGSGVNGINCTAPASLTNTIVEKNTVSSATCTFAYSLFHDAAVTVDGSNKEGDPMFVNHNPATPLADDYYRIAPTSAAIDSGEPASTVMTDIDGEARPQGSVDIGADEYN